MRVDFVKKYTPAVTAKYICHNAGKIKSVTLWMCELFFTAKRYNNKWTLTSRLHFQTSMNITYSTEPVIMRVTSILANQHMASEICVKVHVIYVKVQFFASVSCLQTTPIPVPSQSQIIHRPNYSFSLLIISNRHNAGQIRHIERIAPFQQVLFVTNKLQVQ